MKGKTISLDVNPLSNFSDSLYCKVKYHKTDKLRNSERIVLKALEKKSVPLRLVRSLVWSNFEKRCYCEHDCCGHWFSTFMDVKRISKNKFSIVIGYAQNY